MFVIKKGTPVKLVLKGRTFSWDQMRHHVMKKDLVIPKENMIVDPTGIAKWAVGPQHKKTIGGAIAEMGFYGFDLTINGYDAELGNNPIKNIVVASDGIEYLG